MAVDMFLKIDDVQGESVDGAHAKEMEILAWSWGMSQTGTTHSGAGGGAGKVDVQDIHVTKYLDKASPVLMKMCCKGTHFKEAVFTVRKAGDKPLEYLKITMKEGLISTISVGGSQGDERTTENVTLNFALFNIEYVPQKADGTGDAAVPAGWNIATNQEP
jgi:type VI secretion system secreted protein Hcp